MKNPVPAWLLGMLWLLSSLGAAAQSPASAGPPGPWPRQVPLSNGTATMYQPQVTQWQGDDLEFRAAVSVRTGGASEDVFGVVWGMARTDVDRVSRMVLLNDLQLQRVNFPSMADGGAQVLYDLRQFAATHPPNEVPLDFLQASLGASQTVHPNGIEVRNTPPRIVVSTAPALLVTIQGATVLKPVPDAKLERVINTRALILRTSDSSPWYLHVYDGWMQADSLDGAWTLATDAPSAFARVASELSKKGVVDLLDGGPNAKRQLSLADGAPSIIVAHDPTELIVFKGEPDFIPVPGTDLLWGNNTTANVLIDTQSNHYYALLSGRWYSAPSLEQGPWSYVPANALPPSFAKIPADSPAGAVLMAVAGTPQAQEAVIASTIPQTATVPRVNGPTFEPIYDGAPQFRPIEGTPLSYVVNSDLPVIRIDPQTFYGVQAGVWFMAHDVAGPWSVAISVPPVIYTIPPSAPLYYVTYVKIYESTPESVYVGYTPGYTGEIVSTDGTVVYGTGYWYEPWVGTDFYPVPVTYGVAAVPVYNPAVGFAYGFAVAAAADPYWFWGTPYYVPAYWGTPCCGTIKASTNVYRYYGNTVASGTRTWYQDSNGKIGTTAQGTYTNTRTGTTGTYYGNKSYNPNTGKAQANTERTFDTARGTSGEVSRSEQYNTENGNRTYDSSMSATGAGGSTVEHSATTSLGSDGVQRDASTTVDSARTGHSYTYDNSGAPRSDYYAGADGNVYRNDGSGWQQNHSDGSWQNAGSQDWANREAGARDDAGSRFGSFGGNYGGWGGNRPGGGNFGGWGGGRSFGGGFRGRR